MIWISEMITMDNKIMTSKRKLTSSRTAIIEAIQFKTGKKMLRTSFTSIGWSTLPTLMKTRTLAKTLRSKLDQRTNLQQSRSTLALTKTVLSRMTCPERAAKHSITSKLQSSSRNSRRRQRSTRRQKMIQRSRVMKMAQRNTKSCTLNRASIANWVQVANDSNFKPN